MPAQCVVLKWSAKARSFRTVGSVPPRLRCNSSDTGGRAEAPAASPSTDIDSTGRVAVGFAWPFRAMGTARRGAPSVGAPRRAQQFRSTGMTRSGSRRHQVQRLNLYRKLVWILCRTRSWAGASEGRARGSATPARRRWGGSCARPVAPTPTRTPEPASAVAAPRTARCSAPAPRAPRPRPRPGRPDAPGPGPGPVVPTGPRPAPT